MKKLFALVASLFCSIAGYAGNTTDDAKRSEIVAFIRKLYSTPINDIEGKQHFGGGYNPDRGCEILKSFFVDRLIVRERPTSNCDTTGSYAGPFRYPSIDGYEIGLMEEKKTLPRYRLDSILIFGSKAVAKINVPSGKDERWGVGRTVYFLTETQQGWRIANLLTYNEWPLNLKGEYSDCRESSIHYSFALPPKSPEDFEDLPPACREMELDDRRRNGWGR